MTDDERTERIAAIQDRQLDRTLGVWEWDDWNNEICTGKGSPDRERVFLFGENAWWAPDEDDPDLILTLNAPADIDFLLAEVARLEQAAQILDTLYLAISAEGAIRCPACQGDNGGHNDPCSFIDASNWLFLNVADECKHPPQDAPNPL